MRRRHLPAVNSHNVGMLPLRTSLIRRFSLRHRCIRSSDRCNAMMLDYIALGILVLVVLTFVYGIIAIHDIPYDIAKARNHPHQDAIQAAGWVSLFTLHVIWPFLWIWAM